MLKISHEELNDRFFALIDELNPDLFIEAGANNGETSIRVHNKFPSCDVVAYEANEFIYNQSVHLFDNNPVKYLNVALSDKVGKSKFFIAKGSDGPMYEAWNNSLKQKDGWEYEEQEVKVDTIDNRFKDSKHSRIAMWVDVEGHAMEVLKGSSETLKRVELLKIELERIQHWKDQSVDEEVAGFLLDNNFVPIYRDTEWATQYNIIFIKNNSNLGEGIRTFDTLKSMF
tara:strand:- start:3 stop:686 length:684 start_codon:yes stop_codon:yes gene_type:complete